MAANAHSVSHRMYDASYLFSFSLCVYGGGNRREQIKNVEKGVEIVIGELI